MQSNWLALGAALCALAATSGCIGTPERIVASGVLAVLLVFTRRRALVMAAIALGLVASARVESAQLLRVEDPNREHVLAIHLAEEALDGRAIAWVAGNGMPPRRARVAGLESDLQAGARLIVRGRLRDLTRAPTPDRRDPRRSARAARVQLGVRVKEELAVLDPGRAAMLHGIRARWSSHFEEHAGAGAGLWGALILGDRRALDPEAFEKVQRLGMAHLLALSGMHTSILAGALIWPLRRRGRRMIRWAVPGLIAWMILAGSSASLVRATGMVTWWVVARGTGRSSNVVDAIAAVALLELALRPHLLYGVGWWLSYAATLAVVRCASQVGSWPKPLAGIAISVAAQLATLPWVLDAFGAVNLVSAVTLLFVAPLFAAVLVVGLGAWCVGALVPWLSAWCDVLVLILSHCFGASLALLRFAGEARVFCPGFSSTAWAIAVGCVALLIWPGRWGWRARGAGIVSAVLVLWILPRDHHEWITFDIGQGDGALLRCGREVLVVDAGPRWVDTAPAGWTLADWLRRRRVDRVRISVSHGHLDHNGGLPELLADDLEREVLVAEADRSKRWVEDLVRSGARVGFVQSGDRIDLGHCQVDVLWPPANAAAMHTNDRSLVLSLGLGRDAGERLLMMGDLEHEAEELLLEDGLGTPRVHTLKVAHHGGNTGTSDEFLRRTRPGHALLSSGAGNRYGHPTAQVLERLHAVGSAVYRTDRCGYLRLTWSRDGVPGAPRCVHGSCS